MRYYIRMPGDDKEAISSPNNVLGDVSYDTFYSDLGFKALGNIISKYPEMLDHVTISDDFKKYYSVVEFLDTIRPLKIAN